MWRLWFEMAQDESPLAELELGESLPLASVRVRDLAALAIPASAPTTFESVVVFLAVGQTAKIRVTADLRWQPVFLTAIETPQRPSSVLSRLLSERVSMTHRERP